MNAQGIACLDAKTYASRLVRSWRAFLAFADANKAEYLQLFGLVRASDPLQTNDSVQLAMIERYASLIQEAANARELERPGIGSGEANRIGALLWVQMQGFANMRLNGIDVAYHRNLEIHILINGLIIACFAVASTPIGLEAAATAAMNGSRFKPMTLATESSGQVSTSAHGYNRAHWRLGSSDRSTPNNGRWYRMAKPNQADRYEP